jgi:NAD(P)-dependent dehydrogenase (short-subunit alcohol dehydrogenase family)
MLKSEGSFSITGFETVVTGSAQGIGKAITERFAATEASYVTGQCFCIDGGMMFGYSDGAVKLALHDD